MPYPSKDAGQLRTVIRLAIMEWINLQVDLGHDPRAAAVRAACMLTREALDSMKAADTMDLYMSAVGPLFAEHAELFIATLQASAEETRQ